MNTEESFMTVEYQECRSAIGRFDGVLTSLRIRGFALVLAFSGGAAIVSGTVATISLGGEDIPAAAIVQIVALFLIVPIAAIDVMHTRMLLAAVDRAEAIEHRLGTDIVHCGETRRPLTRAIEKAVGRKLLKFILHWVLYGVLVAVGLILAYLYWTAGVTVGT